jgi:hypothetical protein
MNFQEFVALRSVVFRKYVAAGCLGTYLIAPAWEVFVSFHLVEPSSGERPSIVAIQEPCHEDDAHGPEPRRALDKGATLTSLEARPIAKADPHAPRSVVVQQQDDPAFWTCVLQQQQPRVNPALHHHPLPRPQQQQPIFSEESYDWTYYHQPRKLNPALFGGQP